MKRLLYILTSVLLLSSCDEVINPELENQEPKLVVEALVTNQPGPYRVNLSKSVSFYSTEAPPPVSGATIVIYDDAGNTDTLTEAAAGEYMTSTIQGQTGRTYYLEITESGQAYFASSPLLPVTTVDSVKINYYEGQDFVHQKGYYPAFYAEEPQDQTNYYMWKFYKNGEFQHRPGEFHITDDAAIDSEILGLETPYVYEQGDHLRVEMYSLTREGYEFYSGLSNNLNNDGGFFSAPPSNPPNNISGGAYGFFQVSALEVTEVEIK